MIRKLVPIHWNPIHWHSIQLDFKNARKKALKYFAIFLLFMIFCTVISRGIYAEQMPRVETGQASSKSITHMISVLGSIEAATETAVVLDIGIRIREICVKEGEKVEKGDDLIRLDTSDLEMLMESLGRQIAVAQVRIEALKSSNLQEQRNIDTARQRAREDLSNTARTQDAVVSNAQKAYAKVSGELSAYPGFDAYLKDAQKKDSQYQLLKEAAEKREAKKADKRAFAVYEKEFASNARSAWETGKKALEENAAASKAELDGAITSREDALRQARRNVSDAEQSRTLDKSSVMEAENDLSALKMQQKAYQKLLKKKGRIVSRLDGFVETVCVAAGDRTSDSAALFLADGSDGWNFKAQLNEAQAESIKAGDTVTLEFQNGEIREEDCMVTAVSKNAEGIYEAVVKVTESGLSLGETGTLKVTTQTAQYSCCVPLSALYTDNNKDYVLLIRETNTILGTELSAVKREVVVRDKNESDAALADGALGAEDLFVTYASKAVVPGDKVRLMEDDESRMEE